MRSVQCDEVWPSPQAGAATPRDRGPAAPPSPPAWRVVSRSRTPSLERVRPTNQCETPPPRRAFPAVSPSPRRCGVALAPGASRPRGCGVKKKSPLRLALESGSAQRVQEVLSRDPSAASEPFFEDACDPPLCCAVRLGRRVEVVRMLVAGGADIDTFDVRGFTPLTLLCHRALEAAEIESTTTEVVLFEAIQQAALVRAIQRQADLSVASEQPPHGCTAGGQRGWSYRALMSEEEALRVAALLLAAGADPELEDFKGRRAAGLALRGAARWRRMAALCAHYRGAQACFALLRASSRHAKAGVTGDCPRSLVTLPRRICHHVCGFLVPSGALRRIAMGPGF